MNRKQILSGATIATFAAILLAWAPSAAVQAEPATVGMEESGCGIFTLDGFVGASFHSVQTNNNNGNEKLTCKAEGVANTQGSAYKLNFDNTGISCGMASGTVTTNWQTIVSDNGDGTGDVTLQCRSER